MSTVLNMKSGDTFARWQRGEVVYIGRRQPYRDVIIPESPLHNPFHLTDGEPRGATIGRYRAYLEGEIAAGNKAVITGLLRIAQSDGDVVCWCSPLPCHGQVVLEMAARVATEAGFAAARDLVAEPIRLIIAGGRDFDDWPLLRDTVDRLLRERVAVTIIAGGARGADALAARYAKARRLPLVEMPAQWDADGRRAGFVRNEKMAQVADGLVAFWDGVSPGTGHMIATMQALGKRVVRVAYGATGVAGDRSRLGRGRNVRHVDEKPKGRP